MGIQNLLPLLNEIQEKSSLKKFKGETIGVDAYCWIHRACYSCAMDLGLGIETTKYLTFIKNRILLMQSFEITPILVFDGGELPLKDETNNKRRISKLENKTKAIACYEKNDKSGAYKYFQQCVNVTMELATNVIQLCKEMNLSCIVAPYEADAQLYYLFKTGIISAVMTEDSDLLVFGCTRVLFKMDNDGKLVFANLEKIVNNKFFFDKDYEKTLRKLRVCSILSGCDYLKNIEGIGLKKAIQFYNECDGEIEKIIKIIPFKIKKAILPPNYLEKFLEADNMFDNQIVFDIKKRVAIEITSGKIQNSLQYKDRIYHSEDIVEICLGNINPMTGNKIMNNIFKEFKIWIDFYQVKTENTTKIYEGKENRKRSNEKVVSKYFAKV